MARPKQAETDRGKSPGAPASPPAVAISEALIVLLEYGFGCSHTDRFSFGRFGRNHPQRAHGPVMGARSPRSRFVRPGRISIAVLGGVAATLLLLSSPLPSRADIYRWEDAQGTIHFTDDITSIPSPYRKSATRMIREAPFVPPAPQVALPPEKPPVPPPGIPPGLSEKEQAEAAKAQEKEELTSRIEQLRAKITAKEQHINAVDAKRSLAVNPLRNRIVDQADMDLYEKYQSELPADRQQLKELESLLE
jgi:hypothetical protein